MPQSTPIQDEPGIPGHDLLTRRVENGWVMTHRATGRVLYVVSDAEPGNPEKQAEQYTVDFCENP